MITKEQVEKRIVTEFYSPESAWIAKANITWAIEQLTPELERLHAENRLLHEECSRRREDAHNWKQIAEIRVNELAQENALLCAESSRIIGAIRRIIEIASRGDVNIQPLLAPIMDTAKNALK